MRRSNWEKVTYGERAAYPEGIAGVGGLRGAAVEARGGELRA